ncbi:MAG: SurA N-terminal domain-containing protein, partial [Hyphomicrobiales bacterium]
MLETLRKTTGSWITKIFLGLLVVSFAVWGVADIFRDFGTNSIAKVGETEVETFAFQSAYRRELATVASRLGRQLTPDEAKALGIDRRVLSDLLTTATLVNQASQLRLGISDDFIAQQIAGSEEFKDSFGRFDRSRFDLLLANNGLNEQAFVTRSRNLAVRDQIAATVAGSPHVPKVMTEALNEFQNGERVVEYFTLPPVELTSITAPSTGDLEKFYDANKPRFTLPEFRKLSLLILDPADLSSTIEVSDKDIATEYEARRAQYETAEKRAV